MTKRVIPLEANPDIFNDLAHKIGLSPIVSFQDVYSITDPDMLAFLPQPVLALVMLFPITEQYELYRQKQDLEVANDSKSVVWFKQTIGNGCGLYGLLHAVVNLHDLVLENSVLNKMLVSQLSPQLSTAEVARLVEQLEEHIQLDDNYGSQGQTEAPDADSSVNFHFMTFVRGSDGHVYELDGRRSGPIDLGALEAHVLGNDAVLKKIQFYMNSTDEDQRHNFALMAIAPAL